VIHLGDITKIHGDQIEPVDCITFGSPCQDLSIAGRRAGLAGGRSGLFVEAVRIIKEMRKATNGMYPTFAIWENVPGAFSSNGGEDFRVVLEELARVEQPDAIVPRPPRGGRWSKAGAIAGAGWSLAWRQLDAQHWGVPQRRKRIALVADFGGQRASEILFERTSLSRHPDEGIPTWKSIAGLAKNCAAGNDRVVAEGGRNAAYTLKIRSGCAGGGKGALVQTEKTGTLSTLQDQTLFQPVYCLAGNIIDRSETAGANGLGVKEDKSYTLNTVDRPAVAYKVPVLNDQGGGKMDVSYDVVGTLRANAKGHDPIVIDALPFDTTQLTSPQNGSNPHWGDPCHPLAASAHTPSAVVKVFDARGNGDGQIVPTITGDHERRITDYTAIAVDLYNGAVTGDTATSITCRSIASHSGPQVMESYGIGNGQAHASVTKEKSGTLDTMHDAQAVAIEHMELPKKIAWIVRRLTPTECERLQGYPDGWTDIGEWTDTKGKKHKAADSPRYKALGNSIALPQWFWIVQKMKPYMGDGAKLGSLFDGIGGFPLVWETTYGTGTAAWASEIEEFPIAVTKKWFGEKEVKS
jgi:DNA (cytosine-5)-methyltransferase 1